jgi:hypothetical protein
MNVFYLVPRIRRTLSVGFFSTVYNQTKASEVLIDHYDIDVRKLSPILVRALKEVTKVVSAKGGNRYDIAIAFVGALVMDSEDGLRSHQYAEATKSIIGMTQLRESHGVMERALQFRRRRSI